MAFRHGTKSYPLVVLVGRVNVGKSTFFNRLTDEKRVLASPNPGTTRDVNIAFSHWRGFEFAIADTCGFIEKPTTTLEKQMMRHAHTFLRKADVVLFLVDIQKGYHPDDRAYLLSIRRFIRTKIVLVANKADKLRHTQDALEKEWLALGCGAPFPLSAASGRGAGDLLDSVVALFKNAPRVGDDDLQTRHFRVALVGRTNVGKSSLFNGLINEERVIVSPEPHTTREPQDALFVYRKTPLVIIDTAGMRKKSRVRASVEREGIERSIGNIQKADVALLVLESIASASKQESRLAQIAHSAGVGLILIINKWDLVAEKDTKSIGAFERYFKSTFEFVDYAPMLFVSALTGKRLTRILDSAIAVGKNRACMLDQSSLDVFLKKTIAQQKPQWIRGKKKPVIYGFTQTGIEPPTFALRVKDRVSIPYSYLRFLENRLREQFDFSGTPLRIHTEQHIELAR